MKLSKSDLLAVINESIDNHIQTSIVNKKTKVNNKKVKILDRLVQEAIGELVDETLSKKKIKESGGLVTEQDTDKYQKAIDVLEKKRQLLLIQAAKLKLSIKKIEYDRSVTLRGDAEEALDNSEARGQDTSAADDSVNNAKKAEIEARKSVSAANDALKSIQKGGMNN